MLSNSKVKNIINLNYKYLALLWQYISDYKGRLITVLIALTFSAFSVLALGKAIAYLIDLGFQSENRDLLNQALIVLFAIITLLALATFTRSYLINTTIDKIVGKLRNRAYQHVIYLSPQFFEINKTSDIISRLTTDLILLNSTLGSILTVILRNSLMTIGGFISLFLTSIKLTLCVLMIVPIVLLIIIIVGRKVRQLSKNSQESIAGVSAHIEETINGIKTVKAFMREKFEIDLFIQENFRGSYITHSWIKARASLAGIVILIIFSAILLVLWIGGQDVIRHKLSAGELSSFIFYAILVASSIGGLSEAIGDTQRAAGALERLFDLLQTEQDIKEPDNPKLIAEETENIINFAHIKFCYPSRPDKAVLDDFSLTIKKGEKIALVGPSGSGKSTLFQLLLRFYDPTGGVIYLGNTNIKELTLENLRQNFAIVSQESVIFSASAFDNIRYGKIDASEEEVRLAAQQANILDFLDQLPQGLHTFLGEKGVRLSGGQKQRIALARAIIRNPKILLLDEATSNLDSQNEKLVQESLEKIMLDRTTIIIAHRLSTVINADRIIVLNNGKIEAIGQHAALIKAGGLYARLAHLQQ